MPEDENKPTIIAENIDDEWADTSIALPTSINSEQNPHEEDNEEEVVEEPVTPEDEVEVQYVADPGEYVPQDYSFEVTTFDEKNEHPKSHKITSVEEWETLMESDPNFGSVAALDKAMRLSRKMESNQENDFKAWKRQKDDFDAVKATSDQEAATQAQWVNEIDYLINRGDLPKITKAQAALDWNDPEVAKQDGIREQVELLKFMKKENAARVKANLSPMTSILDVYNAYKLTTKGAAAPSAKEEAKIRQAAGAKVASGSAGLAGAAPKGIAVGRGGSLDDLSASWWD